MEIGPKSTSIKTALKFGIIQRAAMNPSSTLRVVIPRGTKFLAYSKSDKANPYNFVVTENVVAIRDNDQKYWPIVSRGGTYTGEIKIAYGAAGKLSMGPLANVGIRAGGSNGEVLIIGGNSTIQLRG
ncbi:hypothetical protein vBKpnAMK6_00464 [Klebsiella phage vB_Kpn_AM_K6]